MQSLSVSEEPPRAGWRQNDKLLFFRVPVTSPHPRTGPPQATLYHTEHMDANLAWALEVSLRAEVPPQVVYYLRARVEASISSLHPGSPTAVG